MIVLLEIRWRGRAFGTIHKPDREHESDSAAARPVDAGPGRGGDRAVAAAMGAPGRRSSADPI